jgi:putative membrane protein
MMWWYGPGMNAWGYGLMTVCMVLFWGLIVFGIVPLIRFIGQSSRPTSAGPTPKQLLDERFARGEIDGEEYRRRLELMSRSSVSPG